MGDHCDTHVIRRMKRVIDGDDLSGNRSAGWKGGGGFRYYHLSPVPSEKDRWGNWVIAKGYERRQLPRRLQSWALPLFA